MFDVKVAEEIMRRDLITLSPDSAVLPSISTMLDANISGAPVVDENGAFLGVFSEKCSMNALTLLVEAAVDEGIHMPLTRDFMKTELTKLSSDRHVFDAIEHILSKKISGAPVVDREGIFHGVFSEKTAMQVLMAAIHDSVPGSSIAAFMNKDRNRIIAKETPLIDVAHMFQQTSYRRLAIVKDQKLVGQVSRRDVLRAELKVATTVMDRVKGNSLVSETNQGIQVAPVGHFMDRSAMTIRPRTDLLGIAQLFLNSPYRRLPVLDDNGLLLGQVSRRDLLEAASGLLRPAEEKMTAQTLYLSQVAESRPSSI